MDETAEAMIHALNLISGYRQLIREELAKADPDREQVERWWLGMEKAEARLVGLVRGTIWQDIINSPHAMTADTADSSEPRRAAQKDRRPLWKVARG